MGRWKGIWLPIIVAALTAGLAAACGGGDETPSGSPTPPPSGEEAALAPCRALDQLKRYRYATDLKLESPEPSEETPAEPRETPTVPRQSPPFTGPFLFEYKVDASFVAPDRTELVIDAGTGTLLSMIVIGDRMWSNTGFGWKPATNLVLPPYRPDVACPALFHELDLSTVEPQSERVNDAKTLHYSLAGVPAGQALVKLFGSGSDADVLVRKLDVEVWLEEKDNWPARLQFEGSGFYSDGRELRIYLLIDVTDVNSKGIKVEAPS